MFNSKKMKRFIILFLIVLLFLTNTQPLSKAYASKLSFYNATTGANVNYSGTQVIYTYNGQELKLSYPGIIVDGTALADYEELFVQKLGLQAELLGENIIISNGTTELILTLGSKTVWSSGTEDAMSVAPVKLLFDDTVKYYVPTRYVAEFFGFQYTWFSSIGTVQITKTLPFSIEGTPSYNVKP